MHEYYILSGILMVASVLAFAILVTIIKLFYGDDE
jgi:hypothetical protein